MAGYTGSVKHPTFLNRICLQYKSLAPPESHAPVIPTNCLGVVGESIVLHTMYSIQCIIYISIIQCTVYNIQCSVYNVMCKMYIIQCTVYNIQFTVYCVQFTVYSVQCTVYRLQYTVNSIQCIVYSVQCTVYSIQCAEYSVECGRLRPSLLGSWSVPQSSSRSKDTNYWAPAGREKLLSDWTEHRFHWEKD